MYKLLIVDDEYLVRRRLVSTIDWASLGISEIYEAEEGRQALGISIENEPDIIITDINMPELSGIELMRSLNESALCPRVILISGYNEFEYARSALKLGAVDYLLKPVDENELLGIIKSCIEDFESHKKEKELLNALVSSSAEIRKRVLADLLSGKVDDPDNSLLRLKHIGIDFPYSSAICIIAHSNGTAVKEKSDYVEETLISFSISNVMEDILPLSFAHFFIVQMDDMNVAVLFSDKTGEELQAAVKDTVDSVKEQLDKLFNANIAFGVGVEVSNLLDLSKSYKTASYAINFCNYKHWDSILNYGESVKTECLDLQSVYSDYNLKAISADIKNGDRASASAGLKLLTDEFLARTSKTPTPLQIKLFYINAINTLFKNCLVSCKLSEEFVNICMDSLKETGAFFTIERLTNGLQKIVGFLLSQYSTFIGNKRHWLIDRITEYIQENYSSSITMKSVARRFYLNPSYFCKLFRDETGVTFTHYLMRLRVEKAKELMSVSTKKFYDIATAVGYSNVQYFSTIFKEIEGITPTQYRNAK